MEAASHRTLPSLDEFSRWQVATFGVLGAVLGYGTVPSHAGIAVVVAALLAMGARLLVGVRRVRLPEILDNGTTRVMCTMSSVVNDSELSANIYAAAWLRNSRVGADRADRRLGRPGVRGVAGDPVGRPG